MRKINLFYLATLMIFSAALTISSCTKEGPAGTAGTDGTPGVDANTHCLNCHTAVKMGEITTAFVETPHVMGSSFGYAGSRGDCAFCHSHDGFVEYTRSGNMITPAAGTPLECGTCHGDHASLEEDAMAPMREVGPVIAVIDESGETIFDHGMGNSCATCHQARRLGSYYDKYIVPTLEELEVAEESTVDYATYKAMVDAGEINMGPAGFVSYDNGVDSLFITFDIQTTHVLVNSTHAGPHHGPQANVMAGMAGYPEVGVAFDRDHHTDCAGCHLHNEVVAGFGHTFAVDAAFCNDCHGDAFDMEGFQTDVVDRMHAIELKLEEIHAIHVEDGEVHPLYSLITREQFQAFWNFMCILEDNSGGIHNTVYTNQMLDIAEAGLGL